MSIDRKGRRIHVGDIVSVPCVVKGVDQTGTPLSVLVETLVPGGEIPRQMLFNANQVEITESLGESALDIDVKTAISDTGSHILKTKDLQ